MKHKHSNRILGRKANHRKSLLINLTSDLLKHGSLVTSEAKGKELRRYFEPLVTAAKAELTLHRRRLILSKLRTAIDLTRLQEVSAANVKRPGGYLRLTKVPSNRHDAAKLVRIDIVASSRS